MKFNKSKISGLLVCSLLTLLPLSCTRDGVSESKDTIDNFARLRNEFTEPSKEYGTIPFFVWNSRITRQDIDSFMLDFRDAGCGGVFIHARPGLITSYLTDEWFELFSYTLDKGKELGIDVWIYDEYNFPSGFAGGHVPAEMPESYDQGQGLQMEKSGSLPEDAADYYLVLKEENGQYIEVTDPESERGKSGNYYLFTKAYYFKGDNDYYFHGRWYGGFTYVDVLYPGVTEKFIQVTMDGYEKYAGEEFGKFMPGIFTDEPHLNSPGGIRWTPDLFDVFKQQWGYDLKMNLPSLFEEVGDWKKIRHNYAQTILQLFIDRWAKPYYEYCESKGLQLTGHYWEHTWPFIRLGPDNMAMYPWFQIPGIDMLFNQFNEISTSAQFGNIRSVKELSSVANQFGIKRTLSESYGGAGWDLTFTDMKRLGDWEYVLGVNLMNQHMSPITIEGNRKYDHPPYFTYHEPWWQNYSYLNTYFARLSVALSSGKQVNDILVIEPTTTTWMYDSYYKPNKKTSEIGNSFQEFVTKLEKAQVEYDLGSENIFRDQGKIENGKFIVGQRSYSRVVVPPLTENIDKLTYELLKEYVGQGGKLFLYSVPYMMDGSTNTELSDLLNTNSDNITIINDSGSEKFASRFENADLKFESIKGGNLYHHRRILQDGQVLFLVNSSLEEATSGELSISGNVAIEMNAFTGEMTNYPFEEKGKNAIRLSYSLPPAGSLLLYISESKIREIREDKKPGNLIPVPSVSPMTVTRKADNVLMMDFCDLLIGGQLSKDINVLDAADMVYKHHGLKEGNPLTHVLFNNDLTAIDTFGTKTGFSATYRFRLEGNFDFSGMKAVVERPDVWSVSVNGKELEKIPGEWWLDRNFGVYDIGKQVKPGENELTLQVSPMNLLAEIQPAYITGDFSVVPALKGWKINAPPMSYTNGSWSTQGLPFYPWRISYSRSFNIQDPAGYYEIGMGKWAGTVSEITVNGKPAGIIAFPPYTLDVSKFVQEGNNTIGVTVVGSLKNLLGPHHNNPPEGLAISPYWRGIKDYPPGKEYQILDYGLMDDISLFSQGENL
ncbi:MAG: hypothetical protein IH594_05305 [Bacteroidales bacterium]|nr:hypothetical protein [Bacteroidales bacterium]